MGKHGLTANDFQKLVMHHQVGTQICSIQPLISSIHHSLPYHSHASLIDPLQGEPRIAAALQQCQAAQTEVLARMGLR